MRGNVAASGRPAMNSYGDWFKQHRAYGEPLDEARYPHPRQGREPYFYLLENETACEGEGRSGDCATYGCDAFGCGEAGRLGHGTSLANRRLPEPVMAHGLRGFKIGSVACGGSHTVSRKK